LKPGKSRYCSLFTGDVFEAPSLPSCNCEPQGGWDCRKPEDCSSNPDEVGDWCNTACGYGLQTRLCCKEKPSEGQSLTEAIANAGAVGVDDGEINTLDYSYLISGSKCWTAEFDPKADLNGDGKCNALDISAFFAAWSLQNKLQSLSSIPPVPTPTPTPTPTLSPSSNWWNPKNWL